MSHYSCRKCGEYMCDGNCETPEKMAKKLLSNQIQEAKIFINKENLRVRKLKQSINLLKKHGEYIMYEGTI